LTKIAPLTFLVTNDAASSQQILYDKIFHTCWQMLLSIHLLQTREQKLCALNLESDERELLSGKKIDGQMEVGNWKKNSSLNWKKFARVI